MLFNCILENLRPCCFQFVSKYIQAFPQHIDKMSVILCQFGSKYSQAFPNILKRCQKYFTNWSQNMFKLSPIYWLNVNNILPIWVKIYSSFRQHIRKMSRIFCLFGSKYSQAFDKMSISFCLFGSKYSQAFSNIWARCR